MHLTDAYNPKTKETEMSELKLQYRLSNGNWKNCDDRTEEFLVCCEKENGPDENGKIQPRFHATRDLTRDETVAALLSGQNLRNHHADWYSECRNEPAPRPVPMVDLVNCSCGHRVARGSVMSASLGTSCPYCYDRMSA
jgi:hypothetical protein